MVVHDGTDSGISTHKAVLYYGSVVINRQRSFSHGQKYSIRLSFNPLFGRIVNHMVAPKFLCYVPVLMQPCAGVELFSDGISCPHATMLYYLRHLWSACECILVCIVLR
jgi:hypothetical protein